MTSEAPLLLTGAGGWFGRTALHVYEQVHGREALLRNVMAFASCERLVDFGSPHGPVQAYPLETMSQVSNPRGLLHLAFRTRDKVEILGLERYVAENREITARVAQVLQAWPAMPVVATSSGAAAALDGHPPDLLGNPYATLKQEEEKVLAQQTRLRRTVLFRVYAASGRFMTRPEKFALGHFIQQALERQPVQVKAKHPVWRSYVSVEQLMQLSWILLSEPDEAPPGLTRIDACGPAVELAELASAVAFELNAPLAARLMTSSFADYYAGDEQAFCRLLQCHQLVPWSLDEQIRETIAGLQGVSARAKDERGARSLHSQGTSGLRN